MINGCAGGKPSRASRRGPQFTGEEQYLGHDLSSAQVTIKAHLARCTERTSKSAAGLGGHADCRACATFTNWRVEHQHRFNQAPLALFPTKIARPRLLRIQIAGP